MKQSEFEAWFKDKQNLIGMYTVVIGHYTKGGQFVIGCYYDKADNKWKIYETCEQRPNITFETSDEDEVFNELKDIIEFEIRNNKN